MGRRGPAPRPTKVNALRGNPGKRGSNKREPKPAAPSSTAAPEWLTKEARKEWDRMVPELMRLGLFTLVDVGALEGYCESRARWMEYEKLSDEAGPAAAVQFGYRNCALKERHSMRAFAAEFGATPSSRSKVSGNPQEPEDPFAEFGGLKVMDGGKP